MRFWAPFSAISSYINERVDPNLLSDCVYSYCDFSQLLYVISQLTAFDDFMQYGQLASRMIGMAVSSDNNIACIRQGMRYENNKDYYDVGMCSGAITSQVLDATF